MARRIRGVRVDQADVVVDIPVHNAYYWLRHDVELPDELALELRRRAWVLRDDPSLDDAARFVKLFELVDEAGLRDDVERQLGEIARERHRSPSRLAPDGFLPDVRRMPASMGVAAGDRSAA